MNKIKSMLNIKWHTNSPEIKQICLIFSWFEKFKKKSLKVVNSDGEKTTGFIMQFSQRTQKWSINKMLSELDI